MNGGEPCRAPLVRPGSRSRPPAAAQRLAGFTLIELMIALGLGLVLVAAAGSMLMGQWRTQRQQLLTGRLEQELRQTLELLLRDARRAGYWQGSGSGEPSTNPYPVIDPATGAAATLVYAYDRSGAEDTVQANERFGWRVHPTNGTLDMRLSGPALPPGEGDAWQAATDPARLRVRSLVVRTEALTVALDGRCERPCPTGMAHCPPTATVRRLSIDLEGRTTADPTLQRRLHGSVLLRAPHVQGRCPS